METAHRLKLLWIGFHSYYNVLIYCDIFANPTKSKKHGLQIQLNWEALKLEKSRIAHRSIYSGCWFVFEILRFNSPSTVFVVTDRRSKGMRKRENCTHEITKSAPGAYFSKVPKLFRPISGATIPFISSQRRGFKPLNPHGNLLGFSYIKSMLKDQLFRTSGLQFDNWLFEPEKFSGLSRNRTEEWVKEKSLVIPVKQASCYRANRNALKQCISILHGLLETAVNNVVSPLEVFMRIHHTVCRILNHLSESSQRVLNQVTQWILQREQTKRWKSPQQVLTLRQVQMCFFHAASVKFRKNQNSLN